ncbi:response regulator transcription factor [Psychrobacillus psychrodurans]|uniref:response regulator transcription factor n=1 Tax=Psychrobacillus TaxID=1221880 RepID=UPI001F4E0874|nr:response regulator transcription factor [Psychrobacillus psychrodurans]MCK1998333.1 response regulator transcription factor [Psychrobacillus psychrodurans]
MKRILIVEDEQYMQELMRIQLQSQFDLTLVDNGADVLQIFKSNEFNLILLDVMLPYINGFELCKEIRKSSNVPILMVTARTDLQDTVKGLELGADDYVTKPFEFEELLARIKSLLRRSSFKDDETNDTQILSLNNGTLVINLDNRSVTFDSQFIELTSKEFQLLALLMESPERVFTREKLLELLWDYAEERELRAIDSHVKNIRTKFKRIRPGAKIIKTVWGMGYQLIIPEALT